MYRNLTIIVFCAISLLNFACQNQTQSQNITITTEAIKMDERFDSLPCEPAKTVLAPYKQVNDSIMSIVIGQTEMEMTKDKDAPQSLLSNFSADVLYMSTMLFLGQRADFSLFNLGGIRGDMPKGDVTKGDLLSVYSFDNKIVILDIQGKHLRQMFQFFSETNIQAIGGAIQLIYENKNTFKEAIIQHKPLDDNKMYKLVTVDFLATGGDNMMMLTNAKAIKPFELTLRDAVMQYFEIHQKKGVPVTSKLDDRVIIENQ